MKLRSAVAGAVALTATLAMLGGATAWAGSPGGSASAVTPTQQASASSVGKPIHGDFDGDGRDDIFWYVAGSGADTLWSGKARSDATDAAKKDRFATQTINISGTYTPIAGDFNGDGIDDIFWYAPGPGADSIWYFTGRGQVTSKTMSISGTYVPYVANFNTTGTSTDADDIFWHSSNGSHLWAGTTANTFASTSFATKPPKNAKVYVGNWRQTNPASQGSPVHQDLLFYVPGTAADSIWAGTGSGTFTQSPVTINGKYEPIIGNFDNSNGAAMTDIVWYAPGPNPDYVWMNTGTSFVSIAKTANGKTYKPVTITAENPGTADDIYWNNPAGTGETIWDLNGGTGSFSYSVVNLSTFGGADTANRTAIVGDFNSQDAPTIGRQRVAAGGAHSCALTPTGGVKCWGLNAAGQLGNGTTTKAATPANVSGLRTGMTAVATGTSHSCALTADYGVKCWGSNQYGQLGNNSTTSSSVPVDVSGLTTGVNSISAGGNSTCAVLFNGTVRCWGQNDQGQLGNNTTTTALAPVTVSGLTSVNTVALGTSTACAVTGSGAKCWGLGTSGQLGNNSTSSSSVPVIVSGLSNATMIAPAGEFTCAVTTSKGVKCWGSDSNGGLGNGSGTTASFLVPTDVPGYTSGVVGLSASASSACIRTDASSTRCWGANTGGLFGNGTLAGAVAPTAVPGDSDLVVVAMGSGHSCSIKSTGTVTCAGRGEDGQLGDGQSASSYTAVTPTGSAFNAETQYNPPSADILWWAPGNGSTQTEVLWHELEAF